MNLDFSDDQKSLQDEARRFLKKEKTGWLSLFLDQNPDGGVIFFESESGYFNSTDITHLKRYHISDIVETKKTLFFYFQN